MTSVLSTRAYNSSFSRVAIHFFSWAAMGSFLAEGIFGVLDRCFSVVIIVSVVFLLGYFCLRLNLCICVRFGALLDIRFEIASVSFYCLFSN